MLFHHVTDIIHCHPKEFTFHHCNGKVFLQEALGILKYEYSSIKLVINVCLVLVTFEELQVDNRLYKLLVLRRWLRCVATSA
jgi:hypothetical protein